jgi:hypothetical protein
MGRKPVDFDFQTLTDIEIEAAPFLQTPIASTPFFQTPAPSFPETPAPVLPPSQTLFKYFMPLATPYADPVQSEAVKADTRYTAHARQANAIKAKTPVSVLVWETDERLLPQHYQPCLADSHFVINEDFLKAVGLPPNVVVLHFYYFNL